MSLRDCDKMTEKFCCSNQKKVARNGSFWMHVSTRRSGSEFEFFVLLTLVEFVLVVCVVSFLFTVKKTLHYVLGVHLAAFQYVDVFNSEQFFVFVLFLVR